LQKHETLKRGVEGEAGKRRRKQCGETFESHAHSNTKSEEGHLRISRSATSRSASLTGDQAVRNVNDKKKRKTD
jgi:hypothetical protein